MSKMSECGFGIICAAHFDAGAGETCRGRDGDLWSGQIVT